MALSALVVEAAIGYPGFVYRVVAHPVTWMGALLAALEARLNRTGWPGPLRRLMGVATLAILLVVVAGVALAFQRLLPSGWAGDGLLILATASLPAQRSLHDHVAAVALALEDEGLEAGRKAVSMIVGRDPEQLDEAGVARAAIESLAENFSDGVVAPAFWIAVAGLAGGAVYKAANTADSMIGHRSARYARFGWAAARFDDLVNLPASRLAALLLIAAALLTGSDWREGWRAAWRDASRHLSPNAGWPEAAMAGALGLSLGGPRRYGQHVVDGAYMGDGKRDAGPADIRAALGLYRTACVLGWLVLAILISAPG